MSRKRNRKAYGDNEWIQEPTAKKQRSSFSRTPFVETVFSDASDGTPKDRLLSTLCNDRPNENTNALERPNSLLKETTKTNITVGRICPNCDRTLCNLTTIQEETSTEIDVSTSQRVTNTRLRKKDLSKKDRKPCEHCKTPANTWYSNKSRKKKKVVARKTKSPSRKPVALPWQCKPPQKVRSANLSPTIKTRTTPPMKSKQY